MWTRCPWESGLRSPGGALLVSCKWLRAQWRSWDWGLRAAAPAAVLLTLERHYKAVSTCVETLQSGTSSCYWNNQLAARWAMGMGVKYITEWLPKKGVFESRWIKWHTLRVSTSLFLAISWLYGKITYTGNIVSEGEAVHGSNSMGLFSPKVI